MEASMSLDNLWMRLKPTAPLGLDLFQLIQGGEDPIGQRLVGKRPEPLGGLHLGGIRWQEHQVDAFRKPQLSTAVPACTIKNQHDWFVWSCSHLFGKHGQGAGEDLDVDRGQQQPAGLPALRMHKSVDIHPLVVRSNWRGNRRPFERPDPSQDRFEANAMLIHRPHFDARLRIRLLHGGDLLGQFF